MKSTTPEVAAEVERFLRTGDSDPSHAAWPGDNIMECARLANEDLESALIAEVMRQSGNWRPPEVMADLDVVTYTR